jgi:hypothetical protein
MACAATFLEPRPGGRLREDDLAEHVDALLGCDPSVVVVVGPNAEGSQVAVPRLDWAVHVDARVGCALGPQAFVSGVILPASPALASDLVDAFEADDLPVCASVRRRMGANTRSVTWALARGAFSGTTLLIEPPRTRPERARAAGSALALVMASHGLSWGLLGHGGPNELEAARQLLAGAEAVERILRAVGA